MKQYDGIQDMAALEIATLTVAEIEKALALGVGMLTSMQC
jgi:hypothetical protein